MFLKKLITIPSPVFVAEGWFGLFYEGGEARRALINEKIALHRLPIARINPSKKANR